MKVNEITIKGKIVKEWLSKWPDLPSLQLARMIYNADGNYKVFKDVENCRDLIRFYRGAHGDTNRKRISSDEHFRSFKTIKHEHNRPAG